MDSVTLLDGTIVTRDENGEFPPLQEIIKIDHACDICPVRPLCQDNNEFDCQVYGMFDGFYIGLEDALSLVKERVI